MHFRFKKGFTLIELCISIAILAIVAGILIPLLSQGIDAWLTIRQQRIVTTEAVYAIEKTARLLREMTGINYAYTSWIQYSSPSLSSSWGDFITDTLGRYSENDPPITPAEFILAEGLINNPGAPRIFSFFKQDESAWATTDGFNALSYIGIRLVMDVKPGEPGGDLPFYTRVCIRQNLARYTDGTETNP